MRDSVLVTGCVNTDHANEEEEHGQGSGVANILPRAKERIPG